MAERGGTDGDAERGTHARSRAGRSVPASPANAQASYFERLYVPWWWYVVALAVAALLAGEVHLSGYQLTTWLPFVIFMPIAVVLTWSLGRSRLEVSAGELRVQAARLPLSVIHSVTLLDAEMLTRAVGRHGDPLAFVFVRAYCRGGVQIVLDDPDDPTPYWIISSRRRAELARTLLSPR